VITSPSAAPFRPFHSTGTAQALPETAPQRFENKQANKADQIAVLRKTHTAEITALRASLKDLPNAEIQKAVNARRAEQKKEITALRAAIKAEAEKPQKTPHRLPIK
jgi:hypothetical protein